ncbi:helix-turn-helix domain-containing protein [Glaesserella parasuis]|uniref:helix-turn-helix domain-containing protein n=1 Tax=Glaesserella parasuis TaxID=738 RepID=UPI0024367881|nr:helix-turn-helix domain-containing protein [Glaesserella parasuis]MDG6449162.1 helix-turn-helix domain-containing protein [Glaesserella parasuis]MDP0344783.1 helix-turn-helix domain-containing protein [Glaesserella parasuis]
MNFPNQHLKKSIKEVAQLCQVSERTARKYLRELGESKSREQYEADAQIRREIAYNLRQQGLKYREIAETLGITANNAQQLVRRYQPTV